MMQAYTTGRETSSGTSRKESQASLQCSHNNLKQRRPGHQTTPTVIKQTGEKRELCCMEGVLSKTTDIMEKERKNKSRPKYISFVRDVETKSNTSANTSLLNESKNLNKRVDL